MAINRFSKKLLKIAGYTFGSLALLLTAFHFWFIHHAEELLENLVESRSNGKLKLEIKKFKFNWFSNRMELRHAVFYSTDTNTAATGYRLDIKNIKVQVKKIWPVIFDKTFLFDSLQLIEPDITVTRLRVKDVSERDTSMSIPQEMGKVYNSIQDGLRTLQVTRFQVENGKFTLINKTKPEEIPVAITNISLRLDNLQVDTTSLSTRDKILFSDNVELKTHHQDISFPDGRHRLSFSNFHVNILNRVAEFDSCTITASKGDSAKASFSIFFDKLLMSNINFDTLYHKEIIKADSVFCINPRFQLDVDLVKKENPTSPRLDQMVQQLMGDMQVAYVSVQNGSFDINTTREGRPSSFTSDNNNFELKGLNIRKDAPRPLTVERFVMAIHNYENFLRDSAYAMQFDSILINNNRISLGNFGYQELEKNKTVNTVTMSQFELQGLSWDNLVFEQQLKAQNVILYHPVINYDFTKNHENEKNIFETLDKIGTILQLDNLDVVDGQVNLIFKNNTRLRLENADIFVLGQQLVNSKKPASIRKSVTGLNFKKGFFKMGDLTADLFNIRFDGMNNRLVAGNIVLKKKDIAINASDVAIESLVIDDEGQQLNINGIRWAKADIHLPSLPGKDDPSSFGFILKNVQGKNTTVAAGNGDRKLSVSLSALSANELSAVAGKLQTDHLVTTGNKLEWKDANALLQVQSLQVGDHQASSFTNAVYKSNEGGDSVDIHLPSVTFTPDINALINGDIFLGAVTINQPVIRLNLSPPAEQEKKGSLPAIAISKLIVKQPEILFASATGETVSSLEWKRKDDNNYFEIDNIHLNEDGSGFSADQLNFSISNFIYHTAAGKSFDAGKGKIDATLKNLKMNRTEINTWDWQGTVSQLNAVNFVLDSIGRKKGRIDIKTAKLNDFAISSSSLLNLRELVKQNTSFNLQQVTGTYTNSLDQLSWYNAGYDKKTKFFSLDSLSYHPVKGRDSYIAAQPYQSDYTTIRTQSVTIGPFDIDKYISDTSLSLGVIRVHDGYMTGFRDKRKEIKPGTVKPLPVQSLKKIPLRIDADSLVLSNTRVEYDELNDKTTKTGKIIVADLNGHINHIKNYDFESKDSLYIQATGLIQDSIFTRLNINQSYSDSLGSFYMTVQMTPADIRVLNPVLIPLASVELKSGSIDTLMMQVYGNDDIAYGKIKMIYKDLKVKVYKNKNGQQRPAAGFTNFIANLIVRNKNKDKINNVFFRRWKDRSAMNYVVKTTMSGISSSVGFKSNRKELRNYKKEIKEIIFLPGLSAD